MHACHSRTTHAFLTHLPITYPFTLLHHPPTVISDESGTITTLGGAGPGRGRGGWPGWFAQAHCYRGQLLGARGRPVPASGAAWASSWALGQWWISGLGQPPNGYLVTTVWRGGPRAVPMFANPVHWLNKVPPSSHLPPGERRLPHFVLPAGPAQMEQ